MNFAIPSIFWNRLGFSLSWLAAGLLLLPILNSVSSVLAYLPVDGLALLFDIRTNLAVALYGLIYIGKYFMIYAPILLAWPYLAAKFPILERDVRSFLLVVIGISVPISFLDFLEPGSLIDNAKRVTTSSLPIFLYYVGAKSLVLTQFLFLPRMVIRRIRNF